MSQAHRDLYLKALLILFSHDSLLDTLLPFHSYLRVRSIYSNVNKANSFVTVGHYRPCGQLGLKIRIPGIRNGLPP